MSPSETALFRTLIFAWIGVAAVSFAALQFLSAPYGRHARTGWGPTIHRTAGWILMESPAVLVFLFFFLVSDRKENPVAVAFLLLWLFHYVHRAFIYPWSLRGGQLRMPLSIAGLGFFFNLVNGYLQGRYLFSLGPERGLEWFADPRFILGSILFLAGYALNRRSDAVLRNLRAPGEAGYKIPYGPAFRFISCPNYFGELVEWLGWAILTWSIPGFVFFLWTAANLVPRAGSHHRWYRRQFPDYPPERRAILPFLY
jgi:hypothetical protein